MINVSNLRKSFHTVEALRGISFNIQQGECYGLLGPNGAGKTTTISILSGILPTDGGELRINGHDLKKDPLTCKSQIGVVPQEIGFYHELSAFDNLLFWGSLYQVPKRQLMRRIDAMMDLLGLAERKNDKVKAYSGGMKRRVNIASALLHNPQVLLMDEPTVGIDPQSRNLIFEVVERLRDDGMTVIYTTHYLEEAERLCDRIGIIDNGEIITQGTLAALKASHSVEESLIISFAHVSDEQESAITREWKNFQRIDDCIHFHSMDIQSDLAAIILMCNRAGMHIEHIDMRKMNLEFLFLNLTGKQLRDP